MDPVFKALADPTRRSLLDELFREDGQTLSALEERFPMTRFGVMKHLRLLEEAGLVVTRRRGREKLHFLNPVPIRLIHDRWVSKYAEPWAATLSDLKSNLEATMEKVFEIYIRTTPERLWAAITDGETRAKYQFGMRIKSDWTPGSRFEMTHPGAPGLGKVSSWCPRFAHDCPRRVLPSDSSHRLRGRDGRAVTGQVASRLQAPDPVPRPQMTTASTKPVRKSRRRNSPSGPVHRPGPARGKATAAAPSRSASPRRSRGRGGSARRSASSRG